MIIRGEAYALVPECALDDLLEAGMDADGALSMLSAAAEPGGEGEVLACVGHALDCGIDDARVIALRSDFAQEAWDEAVERVARGGGLAASARLPRGLERERARWMAGEPVPASHRAAVMATARSIMAAARG